MCILFKLSFISMLHPSHIPWALFKINVWWYSIFQFSIFIIKNLKYTFFWTENFFMVNMCVKVNFRICRITWVEVLHQQTKIPKIHVCLFIHTYILLYTSVHLRINQTTLCFTESSYHNRKLPRISLFILCSFSALSATFKHEKSNISLSYSISVSYPLSYQWMIESICIIQQKIRKIAFANNKKLYT